jgi:hypothetical protein
LAQHGLRACAGKWEAAERTHAHAHTHNRTLPVLPPQETSAKKMPPGPHFVLMSPHVLFWKRVFVPLCVLDPPLPLDRNAQKRDQQLREENPPPQVSALFWECCGRCTSSKGRAWKKIEKSDVSKCFFWRLRKFPANCLYCVFELPLLRHVKKRPQKIEHVYFIEGREKKTRRPDGFY